MDAEKHTTSHLENENKKSLSMRSRCLGNRSLQNIKSIAQVSLGVVLNVSCYLYGFCCGPDCMKAQFICS